MTTSGQDDGPPAPIGTVVPVQLGAACARLLALSRNFESLLLSVPDGRRATRGLDWTLGETAAHVLQTVRVYGATLRGENERRGPIPDVVDYVTRTNREELDDEPERNPGALAAALTPAIEDAVAAARALGPDGVAVFSQNYAATSVATVCGLIVELAVHGYDIARTIGSSWRVDAATAVLGVYAAGAALPLVLDESAAAGRSLHVEVRPRGGASFSVHVAGGVAWTTTSAKPVDAHLSVDPFTFLLLAYGRVPPWSPVSKGRLLVWGRRPWRAVQLGSFFRNP